MLSVIIPCYNSEKYIHHAIESVLNQTYFDYEIILVDNNSSDNTITILNSFQAKHPDKIKVFHELKKGAPAARNKGLSEAKGDWIQFLDSDDELLPQKFERQISIAESSGFDVIIGDCYMHKIKGGKITRSTRNINSTDVWKGLISSMLGITSANLWRKKALLMINGWNETKSSSQEYDLLFRLMKNNDNIGFCAEPLTIVHVREDSVHKSKDTNRLIEILNNNIGLRVDIKQYLKSNGRLTKKLNQIIDEYIYTYLINTTGVTPVFKNKTILSLYVKKKLKELNLNLKPGFIMKFYFNLFRRKLNNKILFVSPRKRPA